MIRRSLSSAGRSVWISAVAAAVPVAVACAVAWTASASEAPPSSPPPRAWFDRSHTVFLPPKMTEKLGATQTFPLFWWNFLVVEGGASDPARVATICRALKSAPETPLAKVPCGADLGAFLPLLRDWARDYPLRHPFPGRTEVRKRFGETYAQATLPMGRELLGVFREDPFGSYAELRKILESQVKMDLPNRAGVFFDDATDRAVVPVQFKTPPNATVATRAFYAILAGAVPSGDRSAVLSAAETTLIGPHASTYANERQVEADVDRVSLLGAVLTAAQIAFLLVSRRARALWLFPPVIVSTGVAALATALVFGSIHGLTLAFGTGLAGLAIDYGLHSAFNLAKRGVWRANLAGILTSVAGFAVFLFSEIPLLRQLVFFAIVGLIAASALFYVLHRRWGERFGIAPFDFVPRVSSARTAGILLLLVAAVPAAFVLRPDLNMAQFDFQSSREVAVRNWLYPHLGVKASLLDLDPSPDLAAAVGVAGAKQAWADANGIALQSVARFLPPKEVRTANLSSWTGVFCPGDGPAPATRLGLSADERAFFAPALDRLGCPAIAALGREVPSYIGDFHSSAGGFISVWLPKDDAETAKVKTAYPEALSLREVVEIFPRTLSAELKWMGPLSVLLASFFLWLYYRRRLGLTLLALVPFFCAAGFTAIGIWAFHLSFSFVSLIAILMIFGLSLDYGVFAVDVTLQPEGRSVPGVWTCLLFAAVATTLGFVPMLVCRHPVLAHLGQTLTLGTVGTALGTLWGVPGIARLTKIRMEP